MNIPAVDIVVLNWNGKRDTLACLASLEKLRYPAFHVIVVDNGSSDDSVEAIRSLYPPERSWLTILENGKNLGYAGGNNVGIRYALDRGTDFVWILNNDTIIDPDSLNVLITAAIDNPGAGIIGSKILCYPDKHLLYSRGESFSLWFNRRTVNIGEVDPKNEVSPRNVDYIVGCAMLAKKKFIESVGLLDETYFAYFEEIDWCFRGRKAGFDVLYVPAAVIYHKGGASTGGTFSPIASYYRTRNWIYFMRKHAAFYHWFTFIPLFSYVFMRRFLKALVKWDVPVMRSLGQAILWNIHL